VPVNNNFSDAGLFSIFLNRPRQWPGRSEKIKEKFFHLFFTTKPTGQGTGLGLSLSYDIIKSHHAEIRVETAEDRGSEFIILLPIY
jgi:C4-dicarboxylate-specific signal transduction histidine kinase